MDGLDFADERGLDNDKSTKAHVVERSEHPNMYVWGTGVVPPGSWRIPLLLSRSSNRS